jgi:N-glycosylase/DNA lyase
VTSFEVEVRSHELDLGLCVSSGQVFRWEKSEDDEWLGVDGGDWYRVTVSQGGLRVESNTSETSFRRLFRLDDDVRGKIARIRELGPELVPYIEQLPGLRVLRPSDVVEEAFCFLCTPNNNLARILKMVRSLAAFGPRLERQDFHRFPDLKTIAELDEQCLREKGFGYRARTIPAIAKQVLDRGGAAWLEGLRSQPYAVAHEQLVSLKGVGPKLADCICLFALHHEEAVPVDTHLWQAAKRHYFRDWEGKSLTDRRYREIGDEFRRRFGNLAGWAHQYLFYDNLKNWRTYRKAVD